MARHRNEQQLANLFLQWFRNLGGKAQAAVVAVVLLLAVAYLVYLRWTAPLPPPPPSATLLERERFLFCWWNMENFFDNKLDGWKRDPDQDYDEWFSSSPDLLKLKLDNLTDALIPLNGGIGPDILACGEIEDSPDAGIPGALVLLRDHLNARIVDPGLHYREILWKHMPGGRSIITAILTRLPVDVGQTHLVYKNERILEGVIRFREKELRVIASHWTSRLTDKTGERRADYGDAISRYFAKIHSENPEVALLVAGDFNDPPEAPSVTQHLLAINDADRVLTSREVPYLFNLMTVPKLAGLGTIADGAKLAMFDQIAVSPGLLRGGAGWGVDLASIEIVTEGTTYKKRGSSVLSPLRFGSKSQQGKRGCSDHLPVVVTLTLPK